MGSGTGSLGLSSLSRSGVWLPPEQHSPVSQVSESLLWTIGGTRPSPAWSWGRPFPLPFPQPQGPAYHLRLVSHLKHILKHLKSLFLSTLASSPLL